MNTRSKLTVLVLVGAMLPALAHAQRVDVRLEDRTSGSDILMTRHAGRMYAAGEPGHSYAIRLQNRSGERVLVVVSVDGVNVISGETANPRQTGYVLEPWQSTTINGWRKNMDEVAAFNFTSLPNSYAARTGRPGDVGVIGVAVFNERRWIPPYQPPAVSRAPESAPAPYDEAAADAASGAAAGRSMAQSPQMEADKRLGTGHGQREWSYARSTEFERASANPAEITAIWYDSHRNLIAQGILPPPRHYANRTDARPFPGFVPDPW